MKAIKKGFLNNRKPGKSIFKDIKKPTVMKDLAGLSTKEILAKKDKSIVVI